MTVAGMHRKVSTSSTSSSTNATPSSNSTANTHATTNNSNSNNPSNNKFHIIHIPLHHQPLPLSQLNRMPPLTLRI